MMNQNRLKIFFYALIFTPLSMWAQVNYTANDRVIPYDTSFRFGLNLGYYAGWNNEQLGNLAAGNAALGIKGIGATSQRPALYEEVLETFGYNALVPDYERWYQAGMRDLTVIVGGPSGAHKDYNNYCPTKSSELFSNLYEPIWDGGANGTPVNERNYYALYLWKTVNAYKKYVKIWEIVNEPDFDKSFQQWQGDYDLTYGWWRTDPNPCDYQLHAPIQHYVRMLRISWEIIKSVDPNAYVSIGALGYAHFLDVVLRNTDNPNGGAVTADFPLKGGAYFDMMGYHTYPFLDGSLWTFDISSGRILSFQRNSDVAVDSGLIKKQRFFQNVLDKYGYNGTTYPKKPWVNTEFNMPRKAFGANYVGSDELQVNSAIKAAVISMKSQVTQLHIYKLSDDTTPEDATFEFNEMGMYKKLPGTQPYQQQVKPVGIAYKTASDFLATTKYDPAQTARMNIPNTQNGGAFRKPDGSFVYVLWAKTTLDRSEQASGSYSFPAAMGVTGLKRYAWDFSQTGSSNDIASTNIALTGAPIFLTGSSIVINPQLPDLTLANLNITISSVAQGQVLAWKVDIRNIGAGAATDNFTVKSYISRDTELSSDDISSGTIPTANYPAGLTVPQVNGATRAPDNLAVGVYYLILKVDADNNITESNENNNILVDVKGFTVTSSGGGGGGTGTDLAVTLTGAPSYRAYTPYIYTVGVENLGTAAFSNVAIEFKFPAGVVSGGAATPSVGTWFEWCAGGTQCFEWRIPTLAGSGRGTLSLPLYVLNPNPPLVAMARLLSSTPVDGNAANNVATLSLNQGVPNQGLAARPIPSTATPVVLQTINPTITEGGVLIGMESIAKKSVRFNIFNMNGEQVKSEVKTLEKGVNAVPFEVFDLAKGVYFIQIEGGGVPMRFVKM